MTVLEANVVSGGGFRDVRRWVACVAALERRVCMLLVEGKPRGTGFLIAPDLLLTAAHVLDGRGLSPEGPHMTVRFDYVVHEWSGEVSQALECPLDEAPVVAFSGIGELDAAVLRLRRPIGSEPLDDDGPPRGWVNLNEAPETSAPGSSIAIFQHVYGGPLKVAMTTESVVRLQGQPPRLFYRTDTMPGSAGGPCFDIDWRFVAMHQGSSFEHGNNFGVPAAALKTWLQAQGLWEQASQAPPGIALHRFRQFQEPPPAAFAMEPELRQAMKRGESDRLEFKAHAVEDLSAAKPKIAKRLVCSIAAFMNAKGGGTILVGVGDDGKVVGLEADFMKVNTRKNDWDGFELWLRDVLENAIEGEAVLNYVQPILYYEQSKPICAIKVAPSSSPMFVDGDFHVRSGPGNRHYRGRSLLAYVFERWSWLGSRGPSRHGEEPADPPNGQ